jgi:hypothetical protein
MVSPSTLIVGAVWVSLGMAMLLWAMLCAATANWGAKRGAEFRKTILISFLLTPIAGLIYVLSRRPAHQRRALA